MVFVYENVLFICIVFIVHNIGIHVRVQSLSAANAIHVEAICNLGELNVACLVGGVGRSQRVSCRNLDQTVFWILLLRRFVYFRLPLLFYLLPPEILLFCSVSCGIVWVLFLSHTLTVFAGVVGVGFFVVLGVGLMVWALWSCVQAGFTGLGVGAAMYGLKPIVEFMTFNFAMQVS